MPNLDTNKILTANHLVFGDAIFRTTDGWSRDISKALVFCDAKSAQSALECALGQVHIVVGPYLTEAVLGADGTPVPSHFREVFRTKGPSNYHHGKQEQTHV